MKILTINTRYIGGGGAAYIANILHRKINEVDGYSSTFLYGRGIEGDENSFRITYPKMDYLSALSYRIIAREININKNIEKYIMECDVVHLHNIHGYYINYVKLFKLLKRYNKKIVWTLHDMWPITGRCAYSFGCNRWKDNCGECKNKKSYPVSLIDRSEKELKLKREVIGSIDSNNMTIVTPSNWLGNLCKESYLNKFNIEVIPNGIEYEEVKETNEQLRGKYNIDINKKVVLFVAADTKDERKGIKYILDIIPQCKDYLFVSIGKEIEGIKYDNFVQLGYISNRNEINGIYKMADVFVIPSLDENFPTTVLESFANGTPVVGFNTGGIPEQIREKRGIIVSEINSNDLVLAIDRILNDKNNYYNECKVAFDEEYNLNVFIERYLKVFKDKMLI